VKQRFVRVGGSHPSWEAGAAPNSSLSVRTRPSIITSNRALSRPSPEYAGSRVTRLHRAAVDESMVQRTPKKRSKISSSKLDCGAISGLPWCAHGDSFLPT
jgi:hypothetical protein